jgi:phage tail-like protein
MPAKIPNPRKQFQFNIIIAGLNPFLVQEVKSPDVDFDVTEHGDTNFDVKTAGRKKLGTITITKIFHAQFPELEFRNWSRDIQNTMTGGGQPPSQYKRSVIIEEYSNDGRTVIERQTYMGCWPSKINGKDLSRRGSDNTTQAIELQVDEEY